MGEVFSVSSYALNTLTLPLFIATALSTVVLVLSFRQRKRPLYRYFGYFMTGIWLYTAAYLVQVSGKTLPVQIFWANVKVTGLIIFPFAWIWTTCMVLYRKLPPRWISILMGIVLVVQLVALWTDSVTHVFRLDNAFLPYSGSIFLLKSTFGAWYQIAHLGYLYLVVLATLLMYAHAFIHSAGFERFRYAAQISGLSVSVVGGIPIATGTTLLDTYAFAAVISSTIHYLAIKRYSLTDVIPLAKEAVMEKIPVAFCIFNEAEDMVEQNRKARTLLTGKGAVHTLSALLDTLHLKRENLAGGTSPIIPLSTSDGAVRIFSVTLDTLEDAGGETNGYLLYLLDVTEEHHTLQSRGEQEKQQQKKLMIDDLHDGIGGSVTVIGKLAGQGQLHPDLEAMQNSLAKIQSIANETSREIRLMMNTYDRDDPDFAELTGDLRHIGNTFIDENSITFTLDEPAESDGSTVIPFHVYVNIVRFFKECIVNIVKHSGASVVSTQIRLENSFLVITVTDNGTGYYDVQNHGGRGMKNMRRRIENMGGEITISSQSGTCISVSIPVSTG